MEHLAINQQAWNRRTQIHLESEFYNVAGFKAGGCNLNNIELEALGDVTNKSLLHLQCHFGLESLSLARKGAIVTGVDLSEVAVEQANSLAEELKLNAHFIASDVLQLREHHHQEYDLVYTSYGVLCWLPDLDKWANVVAASLKPGGQLHLIEFHPFHDVLAGYPYFNTQQGFKESETTYTENSGDEEQTIVTWAHPLSDVINALIKSGLVIEAFNEWDYSPYNCFDGLQETAPGRFQLIQQGTAAPMLYSIVASKPEVGKGR